MATYTRNLNDGDSFTINQTVLGLSVIVQSGTLEVTGDGSFGGASSQKIILATGQTVSFSSAGESTLGLILKAVGGTSNLLIEY